MNTTRIAYTLTIVAFAAGTLFKHMHWPGAAVCLLLGALAAAISFFLAWKDTADSGDSSFARMAILLMVLPCAILPMFPIMHWEGGHIARMIGMTYLILVPTILLFKEEKSISKALMDFLWVNLICLGLVVTMIGHHQHHDAENTPAEQMEQTESQSTEQPAQ